MSNPTESIETPAQSERAQFHALLPLCIAVFSGLLNVAVLGPFVALVAADLDVGVPWIGYTATAALASTAVFGLIVGWLADVAGFRRILVAGLGLLAVSGIGAALSASYALFLLARVVGAVGFAAANGVPNAIAATRYEGQDRRKSLGWLAGAGVMAGLVGPPVLTFVGDLFSWRVAFALVGGFAVLAGVGVRMTVPDAATSDSPQASARDGVRTYLTLLRSRNVLFIYIATILQMAGLIGMMVYIGAYLITEAGMSVRYVGFAFAAQSVGGLLGSGLAGRLPERRSLGVYSVAVGALAVAIFGIYTLSLSVPVTVALMSVAGLSQVTAWVTLVGVLSYVTPVGQGSTMVLNGSMLGVGGAFGSAIGGTVIAFLGYPALGVILALTATFSGVVMWLALRRSPEPEPTE
jgi:predicted MFS family arabinose efflux permease